MPDPFRTLDDPDPVPERQPEAAAIVRDPELSFHAPYQSVLRINGEFLVHFRRFRPGAWRRFWAWALLGWTWEKVE